jgi:hypothetical protein
MTQQASSFFDAISPVEADSLSISQEPPRRDDPHELECLIQRSLQSHPGLRFARLTVHQCAQGVYLEGLLEQNEDGLDLCELVNEIAGIPALNHVVMRPATSK